MKPKLYVIISGIISILLFLGMYIYRYCIAGSSTELIYITRDIYIRVLDVITLIIMISFGITGFLYAHQIKFIRPKISLGLLVGISLYLVIAVGSTLAIPLIRPMIIR